MSLRAVDTWKQKPLFLRFKPGSGCRVLSDEEITINSKRAVEFETDVFRGRVMVCLKGVKGETDPWAPGERFAPKKRCTVITVQGRVKRRLRFDEVVTGWEWEKPLVHLPWGTGALLKVFQTLYPGFGLDLHGKSPHFLNTLCVAADGIHRNPAITPSKALDITRTITPESLNPSWTTKKERKHHVQHHLTEMYYEPDQEYTFDINGDKLVLSNFTGIIGITTLHFSKYLNGQPFPLLARTTSGETLWSLELWHRDVMRDWDGVDTADRYKKRAPVNKPPVPVVTQKAEMAYPEPQERVQEVIKKVVVPAGDVQTLEEYLHSMSGYDRVRNEKEPDGFSVAVELIHHTERNEVKKGVSQLGRIKKASSSREVKLKCVHWEAIGMYRLQQMEAVKCLCEEMMQLSEGRSRQAMTLRELCRKKGVIAAGSLFFKVGQDTTARKLRFINSRPTVVGKKRWVKLLPSRLEMYSSRDYDTSPTSVSLECAQVSVDTNLLRLFITGPKLPTPFTFSASNLADLTMWHKAFKTAINPPQLSLSFLADCEQDFDDISFHTPESLPLSPPESLPLPLSRSPPSPELIDV